MQLQESEAVPVEKILDLTYDQINQIIELRRQRPIVAGTKAAGKARSIMAATRDREWANLMSQGSNVATKAARQVSLRNPANTITLQVACEDYVIGLMARERLTADEFQLLVYSVASLIAPDLVDPEFLGRMKTITVETDPVVEAADQERRAEAARDAVAARKRTRKPRGSPKPETVKKAVTTRRTKKVEEKTGMTQEELKEWF